MDTINLAKILTSTDIAIGKDTTLQQVNDYLYFPTASITKPQGKLFSHQEEHADKLYHVLKYRGVAGDTSPAGRGKTYVASYLANRFSLPVFVLCPKSAIEMWYKILKMWGVSVFSVTNYDMARSSHSQKNVKWYDMRKGFATKAQVCPWIVKKRSLLPRRRGKRDPGIFEWNLPYNTMIIIDEEHVGKNIHTQTFSLIKGAIDARKKRDHKILFLSATPIEKAKTNLSSIMYFVGLIKKPDAREVDSFYRSYIGGKTVDTGKIHQYLYDIDLNDPKCSGVMSSMPESDIPDNVHNYIQPLSFVMDEETTMKIAIKNEAILELRRDLKQKKYSNTLGSINANRRAIEDYKVSFAAKLAKDGFDGNFAFMHNGERIQKEYKRVAIFVNYKSTLHRLYKELSVLYSVSPLHGDQSDIESTEAIRDYNEGKNKVLVSTIKKGGVSVSFHDIVGDKETLVIIFPPTSATETIQTLGRHFRTDVKSSVSQIILFVKGDKIEESIRDSLSVKLDDMHLLTTGSEPNFNLYDLAEKEY